MTTRRLYALYNNTTTPVTISETWSRFPDSMDAPTVIRNVGFNVNTTGNTITLVNGTPSWFRVDAVVEFNSGIYGAQIETQWRLNGEPVGPIRSTFLQPNISTVISGFGNLYLNTNDYIEPFVRDLESNKSILKNCSIIIKEDND